MKRHGEEALFSPRPTLIYHWLSHLMCPKSQRWKKWKKKAFRHSQKNTENCLLSQPTLISGFFAHNFLCLQSKFDVNTKALSHTFIENIFQIYEIITPFPLDGTHYYIGSPLDKTQKKLILRLVFPADLFLPKNFISKTCFMLFSRAMFNTVGVIVHDLL